MKNYINRSGEIITIPPLEYAVEFDGYLTGRVDKTYLVIVLKDGNVAGEEKFRHEPSDGEIIWTILTHDGDKANIVTEYAVETL